MCVCTVGLVAATDSAAAAAPSVTTGAATSVTASSATLTGTVNPQGQPTTYSFEYGPTTAYGSQTTATSAGSGTTNASVSAPVASLSPGTTYHYRLIATNGTDTTFGADKSFTTVQAQAPSATTGGTNSVTATSTTLTGTVNPRGQDTTYHFEYGPTTGYGTQTASNDAGTGTTNVSVSGSIGSLLPDTTYHYRLVATNATGTTFGADKTFKTAAATPAGPAATTGGVKTVTATSAVLTGTVNPKGSATTYSFQYGPSTAYGSQTSAASAGSGSKNVAVSAPVGALQPSTTYHYRLMATNAAGTTFGADRTFTTAKPSTLTLVASPAALTFGQATSLAGTVGGSGPAQTTVTLQRAFSAFGPFVTVSTTTSDRKGGFRFGPLIPSQNTFYRVLANRASSAPVRVLVAFRITLLVSTTNPLRGHFVRFHGTVAPRHNGLRVSLQRLGADHRWHTVARPRLHRAPGNASAYSIRIRVRRGGLYRAVVGPDAGHTRGFSRVLRIRVH